MSEVLASALIPLDGPLPRPPAYTLMSVAEEQTSPRPTDRGGAKVIPYPAALPSGEDPCLEASPPGKVDPEPVDLPDGFKAWTAYLGDVCTASGIGPWDAWKSRANLALAARESWALERQLVNGEFIDSPALQDAPDLPAGDTATAAASAAAYLEGHLATFGEGGTLLLTPEIVTYIGFEKLRDDRGVLRTAAGTPVIVAQGASGGDAGSGGPGAPAGGTAAAAGQSWAYAIPGRVLYAHEATIFNLPDTLVEATDRDTNTVTYRAERILRVAWDGRTPAAVKADWSP